MTLIQLSHKIHSVPLHQGAL